MNSKMTKLMMAIGALTLAGGAMAASSDSNLVMSAVVVNACSIGPGTMAFGPGLSFVTSGGTSGTQANVDVPSSLISYVCTNGASASITGGLGLNPDVTARRMTNGAQFLTYELYTTDIRNVKLGQSAGQTGSIPATADGTPKTATIHGRILGADLSAR